MSVPVLPPLHTGTKKTECRLHQASWWLRYEMRLSRDRCGELRAKGVAIASPRNYPRSYFASLSSPRRASPRFAAQCAFKRSAEPSYCRWLSARHHSAHPVVGFLSLRSAKRLKLRFQIRKFPSRSYRWGVSLHRLINLPPFGKPGRERNLYAIPAETSGG